MKLFSEEENITIKFLFLDGLIKEIKTTAKEISKGIDIKFPRFKKSRVLQEIQYFNSNNSMLVYERLRHTFNKGDCLKIKTDFEINFNKF